MGKDRVQAGVIGFGTVGSGTVKVLMNNAGIIQQRLGFPVELKRVADKDTASDRGISLPDGMLTDDANQIINDPDIDIVVELVGGTTIAKEFILKAIQSGKHVVTANKALLAIHGNEIFTEAKKHGVQVGFEASVAGGIPIIKVLREGLVANNILSIMGIINGTGNYILTKMTYENVEFDETLKEAQELGYAEADPTFDIEGVDAAHKLCLMASLAFGMPLKFDEVYTEGITKITSLDIEFARELGFKIKLLGITRLSDGEVELRVHPTMVPDDHLISKVDGVFNAVYVKGDAVGDTMYYGRGAGDMPTASAVVADVAEIANAVVSGTASFPIRMDRTDLKVRKMEDVESMYYLRFSALDRPGVLSRIAGIFGENNISIASVIQKGRSAGEAVPLVILTHTARERDIRKSLNEIDGLDVVRDQTHFIRVESGE